MRKIRVKIICLWKQYSVVGGESIEMFLVDSSGDKIHGCVKKKQGGSRMMVNFTVMQACGLYRPTQHPYKIVFQDTTRVRNCEDLPHNLSGFNPVIYNLMAGNLDADILVDIISQILEVSHLEVVFVHGKVIQKLSLELRNQDDDRIPMVLWGKFPQDVNNEIQTQSAHSVILVLRFGKIKVWKDERSVSNSYNVYDVALNPLMDEVYEFIRLLSNDDLTLAIVESKPLSIGLGVSDKDDFLLHTPRKTIAEAKASRHVEKCIVMCTIAGIYADMGWYYVSCKYKLYLVVLDSSSNTKILLFDNLATQLIRQPCLELTGPITNENEEPDVLPAAITNLIGKTYLFKFGIERENYQYKLDTLKVLKIITNNDMILEFDDYHSPMQSKSSNLTPAKQSGTTIINLVETFDQNLVTRSSCATKKKEKNEKVAEED
ncbi:hypothetical protein N665_0172s0096 [Sinapis alba]|nr:hypothetical protein N665_0172s0096 [Sinapis alba]